MGDGTSQLSYDLPEREAAPQKLSYTKTFDNLEQGKDWIFIRNYNKDKYHFEKGLLRLDGVKDNLFAGELPTVAAVRQCEFKEEVSVTVKGACEEAGITIYMDENHHYDLYITEDSNAVLRLTIGNLSKEMKQIPVKDNTATLKISASEYEYHFAVENGGTTVPMGVGQTRYLSSEVAGGFTGVVYGLYAVDENDRSAVFTNLSIIHEE